MRKEIPPPNGNRILVKSKTKSTVTPQRQSQPQIQAKSLLSLHDRVAIGKQRELKRAGVVGEQIKQTIHEPIYRDVINDNYTEITEEKPEKNKQTNKKKAIKCILEIIIGLFLTWFGVTNAGSYFVAGTRLGGTLFDIMYTLQFGTIFLVVGLILIYDGIKRTGRV
jgi:hypothetical protein